MLKISNEVEKISTEEIKQLIERVYTLNVNPFDAFVGFMIKKRRKHLNLSQQHVGYMLGITFQQIQKYEKGINRISAERLWDIAHLFQTSYDYYFHNINDFLTELNNPKMLPASYNIAKTPISFEEEDVLKIIKTLDAFHSKVEPKAMPNLKDIASQIDEQKDSSHLISYFKDLSPKDLNDYLSNICKDLPKEEQKKYQQALQFKNQEQQIDEDKAFEKLMKKKSALYTSNENQIETIIQETKSDTTPSSKFQRIKFIQKES